MSSTYDHIVLGVGGIGAAAAYWLARRGPGSVLAIEQYRLGHDRGASEDHSRIIRHSYHSTDYTSLTRAAYEHVRELEDETGLPLVRLTGGLHLAPNDAAGNAEIASYGTGAGRARARVRGHGRDRGAGALAAVAGRVRRHRPLSSRDRHPRHPAGQLGAYLPGAGAGCDVPGADAGAQGRAVLRAGGGAHRRRRLRGRDPRPCAARGPGPWFPGLASTCRSR